MFKLRSCRKLPRPCRSWRLSLTVVVPQVQTTAVYNGRLVQGTDWVLTQLRLEQVDKYQGPKLDTNMVPAVLTPLEP